MNSQTPGPPPMFPQPPTVAYVGDPLPPEPSSVWTPINHTPTCGTHEWLMVAKLTSGPVEYYKYQCGHCQAIVGSVYDKEDDDGQEEAPLGSSEAGV